MLRLNVSSTDADTALQATLHEIHGEVPVDRALDASSVEAAIKDASIKLNGRELSLELLGHADDGVLGIGDWDVDDQSNTAMILRDRVQGILGNRRGRILLLGCNTAATPRGQQALLHLTNLFDVEVLGTTVSLYTLDFGPEGVISNVLVNSDELPQVDSPNTQMILMERSFARFVQLPSLSLDQVLTSLQPETLLQATHDRRLTLPRRRWPVRVLQDETQFRACFKAVVPTLAAAPGLLARPERELLAPVGGMSGHYYRVTILLGGYLARVYPSKYPGGVVVRAPTSLYDTLPTGIEVPLPA